MIGLAVATGVLVVGILGTGHSPLGVVLCFGDALYSAVLLGSRRSAWTVSGLAAAVAGTTALISLATIGGRAALISLLNVGMLLAVPVFWAQEVRRHSENADAERERAEQTRRLAEFGRAAAVAAERARMARDLHDVIAGQLSAIAIQSEAVLSIPDPDPAGAAHGADVGAPGERRLAGGDAHDDRAAAGRRLGRHRSAHRARRAGAAPRAAGHGPGERVGVTVEDHRAGGPPLPAAADLAAYRIVQEALTNVAKHAPGSAVTLSLVQDGAGLIVEVTNPLVVGAPPGGGTGTGLLGLRERAAAVGGSVDAGPDAGLWRLRAVLPVAASVGSAS